MRLNVATFSVVALAAAMAACALARADSACDRTRNDFDGLYCLSKVYQQADVDLNANFERLRRKLDAYGQRVLKTGQLAWIRDRDDTCSRHLGTEFYVNLSCATRTTIARTKCLQDRYGECISSGCMG